MLYLFPGLNLAYGVMMANVNFLKRSNSFFRGRKQFHKGDLTRMINITCIFKFDVTLNYTQCIQLKRDVFLNFTKLYDVNDLKFFTALIIIKYN